MRSGQWMSEDDSVTTQKSTIGTVAIRKYRPMALLLPRRECLPTL